MARAAVVQAAVEVIAVVLAVRDAPPPAYRNHPDGPALVMLDGDSKPNRTAMPEAVYRRIRGQRDDYLAERRVDFS